MRSDEFVQNLIDSCDSWSREQKAVEGKGGSARMSKELFPYDSIFSPISVNKTVIKNRLVMAPMGNIDMCEETGRPNDRMLQYFFERAKGGVGLITTGLIPVSFGIDNSLYELDKLSYFPRIDRSRTVLMGWRDLAQGVHNYGAKIFVQLTAGLGRVGNPQCLINQHKFPVSASFNPNFYIPQIPCLPLSDGHLKKIIRNTGQASADAKAMHLDGVYLHGHEGYLLEQMTNPAFNRRKIGRFAEWQNFGLDMIKEIRRRVGEAFPIMYRIDLSLALNETYGEEGMDIPALRKFKNGRTVEMTLDYMKNLVKAGVDMFDVDLGCYDNWWLPHPPASMPAGCFLPVSRLVKEAFEKENILSNAGVPVPVVAVGKLGYPDLAERALRDGDCDMVMLGRPLLADPEWPNKAYAGRVDDITPCIGCQEGCLNEFVEGGHPQCAVNPRTAFEYLYPAIPAPAEVKKKIAIVGAGPAGLQLAITAARRGHKVELFERSKSSGGKVVPGSVPKIKYEIDNYRLYLERELAKAQKEYSLKVTKGKAVSAAQLSKGKFDTIVFAAGTKEAMLPVKGLELQKVISATDLLLNPKLAKDAENVVVVGGGVVGCECAQYLAYEHGKNVKVIEMLPDIMEGACTANRGHLIRMLKKAGCELINCAKVTSLERDGVVVDRNVSKSVPDPYVTWCPVLPKNIENPLAPKIKLQIESQKIPADLVVIATGGKSDDALYFEAQSKRTAPEIYNIGDSFHAGKVLECTRAAYALGVRL